MGGKSGTTTSSVSIPPEVMARYNAVNSYASDVAKTPFQGYQGQFVAGLTPTQQAGIQNTSAYSQSAQPYYQAATGQLLGAQQSALPGISAAYQNVGGAQDVGSQYAGAATQGIGAAMQYAQPYNYGATQAAMMGSQGIQPGQLQTQQYMNPFTQAVAAPTYQALRQQQEEQMSGQTANAIRSGAFGGDRAALAAANLARQQQLGMAQAMAPIYQQGYGQALQTAQQQQGVQLGAEQANRAAMQNLSQQLGAIGQQGYGQQMGAAQQFGALGQQQYGQGMGAAAQLAGLAQQGYGMGAATSQALAGLGTGAQQAGLQGAQAQMGAGTLEQQTQQADLTARYQQFLQERGYPFQVAQFLANIAMGTGALSGSTTTTQQPMPFFSDRRVKHDVKEIGKTHDGQPIYSFKYNGDNSTQIGLMAQDVEKKHPDAVGEYGGVKTVDYKKATEGAERSERYAGGLVPASQGGAVYEPGAYNRGGYLAGGLVDPNDIQALLQQQQQALGPFGERGLYGQGHAEGQPMGQSGGIVPKSRLHVPKLMVSKDRPQPMQGLGGQALEAYDKAKGLYGRAQEAKGLWNKFADQPESAVGQGGIGSDAVAAATDKDKSTGLLSLLGFEYGGVVPRKHFVKGGTAFSDPYKPYDIREGQDPEEVLDIEEQPELAKAPTPSQSGSSGSGLGTALSLGKFVLGFLKDGGTVDRMKYADAGVVPPLSVSEEPGMGQIIEGGLSGEPLPPLPRGRGVQPEPNTPEALRFFTQSKAQEYGLDPDFAVKVFEGESGFRPHVAGDEGSSFNVPQLHYGKVSERYPRPGLGDVFTKETGLDARDPKNARAAIDWSLKYVSEDPSRWKNWTVAKNLMGGERQSSGVVPAEKQLDVAAPSGGGGGIMDYLKQNQGWLGPLGAGLRGMVQSRSPFLGGALLEGLGSGLEAVGPAQQQLADLARTRAGVVSTLSGVTSPIVGEFDETGKLRYKPKAEYLPPMPGAKSAEGAPTEGLAKTQAETIQAGKQAVVQSAGPVKVMADDQSYRYDVAPTENVDAKMKQFGFTGDPTRDAQYVQTYLSMNPAAAAKAVEDQKTAQQLSNAAQNSGQMRRETDILTNSLMSLAPSGESITSAGPGFDERTYAANVFNWVASFAGSNERIGDPQAFQAKEITDKIRALLGTRLTSQQGFHMGSLAQDITNALPGGAMTEGARVEMLASMWIANQEAEDFRKYYDNYVRKYGTALGVNENFQNDMGQQYALMKNKVKDAITPRSALDENGNPLAGAQPMSYFDILRKNPNTAVKFDQTLGVPGLARVFVGG